MGSYILALLPGDGIGPEVMEQAKKVLIRISELYDINFELIERPCGFDYKSKTGKAWPSDTFDLCNNTADAILLGAIGRKDLTEPIPIGKKTPGNIIVLGLRAKLDLYANVRPVVLFKNVMQNISGVNKYVWLSEKVNLVIVRENSEGFYYQKFKKIDKDSNIHLLSKKTDKVIDKRVISRFGSERIIKFAFNYSKNSSGAPIDGKKRVTCVDKSNVLDGCRLFRDTFKSVAKEYKEIEPDFIYVDAFTQKILQKPEHFNIVVTTNLFGDIITDLASLLQGGLGMAPSANLGDKHGMFEPVHGSAPDIAGKNLANPIGMLLSVKMMLKWLAEKKKDNTLNEAAETLLHGIREYLLIGKNLPCDIGGKASTSQVTKKIIEQINKHNIRV